MKEFDDRIEDACKSAYAPQINNQDKAYRMSE